MIIKSSYGASVVIVRAVGVTLGLAVMSVTATRAEPGLSEQVYGAVVDEGRKELELRYGRLNGGAGAGESALVAEASYGVNDWWYSAVLAQFESAPGDDLELADIGWENLLELTGTKDDALRTAVYAEIKVSTRDNEPGELEFKGIAEYRAAPWNFRFNLIFEREFGENASDETEFGYAARAVRYVDQHVALGVEGFGDLGTFDDVGHQVPQYWGPMIFGEVPLERGELELQAGFLFGFGANEADNQLRLTAEWDFF
jgi:hypothetical protein